MDIPSRNYDTDTVLCELQHPSLIRPRRPHLHIFTVATWEPGDCLLIAGHRHHRTLNCPTSASRDYVYRQLQGVQVLHTPAASGQQVYLYPKQCQFSICQMDMGDLRCVFVV